jgi:DNA-binding PadR family transcriptional regulator
MTDAELAILSIIAEGPIHGHDIQTIIDRRGLRAWTNIGVSSLFYVLEKLERQGLIESDDDSAGQSTRYREFRITGAGFGVLQTAVADLLTTPHEFADGFELGLANLHVLRPSQIRTAFAAYRQELISRLAQTRERWQQLKDGAAPFNVDAMLGHHVAMLEAELAWLTAFIEEWELQAPPDEPSIADDEPSEISRMKQVVLPLHPDSVHRVDTHAHAAPSATLPHSYGPGSHRTTRQTRLSTKTPPPGDTSPPDESGDAPDSR